MCGCIDMCEGQACEECENGQCIKIIQRPDDPNIQGYNYDFSGNDVSMIRDYQQALIKEYSAIGWKIAPTTLVPRPDPGNVPQRVPDFVEPQDKFLVWLATLMYQPLPLEVPGASLNSKYTNSRIGVWIGNNIAYVAFRGTDLNADNRAGDILDDLAIVTGAKCDISITVAGVDAITRLYNEGYRNIQLCGHSLGGRGALCCGNLPGVSKVVVINAAAPFIQMTDVGPGESKATHYHIFGDLISSHLVGARNVRVRVGVEQYALRNNKMLGIEEIYQVDWLSSYYHSTERFLQQDYWEYSTPQEEQDSLEKFFFDTKRGEIEILSLLTSTIGFPFAALIKTKVCENLVPGAGMFRYCAAETSVMQKIINGIMKALGAIIGLILGFKAGEKVGKQTDVNVLRNSAEGGAAAASGDLGPLIQSIFPLFKELSRFAQGMIKDIFTVFLNANKDSGASIDEIKKRVMQTIEPHLPQIDIPQVSPITEPVEYIEPKSGQLMQTQVKFSIEEIKQLFSTPQKSRRIDDGKRMTWEKIMFKIDTLLTPDGEKLPRINKIQ